MVCLLPDTFSAISPAGSVRLCMPASVTLRCESDHTAHSKKEPVLSGLTNRLSLIVPPPVPS